jgi:hypothetical protein
MINNFISINHNLCYARLKNNVFQQCNNNIYCNNLCKKHYNLYQNNKQLIKINDNLFEDNYIHNLLNDKQNLLNKKFYNSKDNFILIKYILLFLLQNNKNYNINDIINNKTKKFIIPLYLTLIKQHIYYNNYINYIIKIQSVIRKIFIKKIFSLKGPALYNRNKSINCTDFYSCENINTINYNYFISYQDVDDKIYSFDVRSLNILISNSQNNPYNRNIIPKNIINNSNILIKFLKNNNIIINYPEDNLTEQQLFNNKVITIFQKIDQFNYNTNINWFTSLSFNNLKQFWILLEDIWNWRANLTNQDKYKIIQNNNNLFKYFYKLKTINDLKILQNYILDDINILISNGITHSDTSNGILYVLIALSNISIDCGSSMPWLLQNNFTV